MKRLYVRRGIVPDPARPVPTRKRMLLRSARRAGRESSPHCEIATPWWPQMMTTVDSLYLRAYLHYRHYHSTNDIWYNGLSRCAQCRSAVSTATAGWMREHEHTNPLRQTRPDKTEAIDPATSDTTGMTCAQQTTIEHNFRRIKRLLADTFKSFD